MKLAPIVLFVFNRPTYTKRVLDALSLNHESKYSDLYIYCDGPRAGNVEDVSRIKEVVAIINAENRFHSVNIKVAEENKGLATSIVKGVTEIISKCGKVIVLEDDIIVSRRFLSYMNFALDFFESDDNVASVNSYAFKIKGLPKYYFLRGSDCWGWGTWKNSWSLYNDDANYLLNELNRKKIKEQWDFGGMEEILMYSITNPKNVWHIKWHTSLFLNNKIGLWPAKSYSINIGTNGDGTNNDNSVKVNQLKYQDLNTEVDEEYLKKMKIEYDKEVEKLVKSFFGAGKHLLRRFKVQRFLIKFLAKTKKKLRLYFIKYFPFFSNTKIL